MVAPLFFGLAHLHHLHELRVHQDLSLSEALPAVSWPRRAKQPGQVVQLCCMPAPALPCQQSLLCLLTSWPWWRDHALHCGSTAQGGVPQVGLQFAYTTLFGWHASWTLLSSGCAAAPMAVHLFCNLQGFPDFEGLLGHKHHLLLAALLMAGIAGFAALYTAVLCPQTLGQLGPDGRSLYVAAVQVRT